MIRPCRPIPALLVVLTVLAAVLATTRAAEPAQPPPAGGPRIEFDRTQHAFGYAVTGQDLRTSFTFKNAGDEALIIERVVAG